MKKALKSGIHIGPGTVRVVTGVLLVAIIATVVEEGPQMVRYVKAELM